MSYSDMSYSDMSYPDMSYSDTTNLDLPCCLRCPVCAYLQMDETRIHRCPPWAMVSKRPFITRALMRDTDTARR